MPNRALDGDGNQIKFKELTSTKKKNDCLFQSTEVEGTSTPITWRSRDCTRGAVQSGKCPGGTGASWTTPMGGNIHVRFVHFYMVDFFSKSMHFFRDFFFPSKKTYKIKASLVRCFSAKSKLPHWFPGQICVFPHYSKMGKFTSQLPGHSLCLSRGTFQ